MSKIRGNKVVIYCYTLRYCFLQTPDNLPKMKFKLIQQTRPLWILQKKAVYRRKDRASGAQKGINLKIFMVAIEKEVYVSIRLYTRRLGKFNFARFFIIWLTVFDQIMWAASACREIHKPASR